jgi:starvation-inducible outer membrane lipoprotein
MRAAAQDSSCVKLSRSVLAGLCARALVRRSVASRRGLAKKTSSCVSLVICVAVSIGSTTAFAETPSTLLDPAVALDGQHQGAVVLWGGRVFSHAAYIGEHCLEVGALPLRRSDGRPLRRDRMLEGQHFIACGPGDFASAAHPSRSCLTVSGTVRGVERRFVRRSCAYLVDDAGHLDISSARDPSNGGCTVSLPIVDVGDARSWREDPTPASMPQL